jgi:hypothetical protein
MDSTQGIIKKLECGSDPNQIAITLKMSKFTKNDVFFLTWDIAAGQETTSIECS